MKHLRNMAMFFAAVCIAVSCSDENDTPNVVPDEGGASTTVNGKEKIVWKKDSTVILTDHFLVAENQALVVEEGVTVIASNPEVKPEIVVLGDMYCLGSAAHPILFTVEPTYRAGRFSRKWGGIICGFDCGELVLRHTTIEYGGAQTTENSLSFRNSLFKTETGEGVPAVHFCNPHGKMLIQNCTFRNNAEDQIYITGGESIVCDNRFICNGEDGGEAINYKSDCKADIAFNLIYDANTNGFKLSNKGFVESQSHLCCYNNTIVDSGWRRPSQKGGSIWLEENIRAELYNNLVYDCRWGLKQAVDAPADTRSVITPNYYYAATAEGVAQMQGDDEKGILNGSSDIMSASAGDKNPLFVYFPQQSDMNINVGSNGAGAPAVWNDAWDFHLMVGSPALTGGNTAFIRHYAGGLSFAGLGELTGSALVYSPAPAAWFGAFGTK